jgi:hypothetical protein
LFWSGLVISSSDIVTGVTYNGVAMTRISYTWTTGEGIYLYYLINPSTGANNIVASSSSSTTIYAQSASYTGAKQTWQPDASNTTVYATQTNMSTSVTTIADNCWLVWVFRSGTNQTAQAWTTLRNWINATIQIWDSNSATTPAGSDSLWVNFSSASAAQIVASFSPSGVVATNSNFFMFF